MDWGESKNTSAVTLIVRRLLLDAFPELRNKDAKVVTLDHAKADQPPSDDAARDPDGAKIFQFPKNPKR